MVRSAPPGGDRPVIADLDNGRVFPAMARRLLPARRPFVWAVAACCLAASADAQAARRPGIEFACYFLRSPADCGFYEQVKAARPTMDFDRRYGSTTGAWTTDMFVEAVYRSLRK